MTREQGTRWLEILSLSTLAGFLVLLPNWRHRVLLHRAGDPIFFEFHDFTLYTNDLLLIGALGSWLAHRVIATNLGKLRLGPWFLTVPLAGLVALSIVGTPLAIDPPYAAYQVLRLLLLLAFYLLLINARLRRAVVASSLAAGMVLQGLVAIPQFLLGRSLGLDRLGEVSMDAAWPGASVVMVGEERWLRAYGLTQHPNLLAGCLMGMLLVVGGYYLMQRGWKRLPALVALAVGFGTLLLTFSRAAWLGTLLGGGMALVILLWAWQSRDWLPNWRALGALAAIALVIAVLFVSTNWQLLRPRLGLIDQGTEIRSVEARRQQVPAAWALIRTHPLLGVGLGNYPTALYHLVREKVAAYPIYQPVYNVVLLVTAELGILGGVLWLGVLSLPWLSLWRRRWQTHITPWWAGLSGALLALTVVSLLDYYVWTSHQGRLVLWLVLGLWAREWVVAEGQVTDRRYGELERMAA
jgi:hypothetical protein